jgi:hypothetical protein
VRQRYDYAPDPYYAEGYTDDEADYDTDDYYEDDLPRLRQRLMQPGVFFALAAVIGFCLGGLIIATGLIPARNTAPLSTPASRNDQRTSAIKSVATAIKHYQTDRHTLPYPLPTTLTEICVSTREVCTSRGLVDLMYLVSSGYLPALPNDPVGGHTEYGTGYLIARSADGTLYLKAMRAEDNKEIELVQ